MEFKPHRPRPQHSTPMPAAPPSDPSKNKRSKRRLNVNKKKLYTIGIIAAIVVVLGVILTLILAYSSNSVGGSKPRFQTALPNGVTIEELGGWKRVSPPKGDPVFAYTDTIDDVPVLVSQQPMPGSLSGNAESQIANLAKNFNATKKLDAEGTSVYVGTSAKGPQSAILTKKGLLILIKSEKKINDAAWEGYVASLH